jgi:hypothetical protein
MGSYNWGFQEFPKAVQNKTDVDSIVLPVLAKELRLKVHPGFSLSFADRNILTVLLTPPLAQSIARVGYSKKDLAEWFWNYLKITVREENTEVQRFIGADVSVHSMVEDGELPQSFDLGPDEIIPMMKNPDLIHIIVCGDATRNKSMSLYVTYPKPVTKEIKLPEKWK